MNPNLELNLLQEKSYLEIEPISSVHPLAAEYD